MALLASQLLAQKASAASPAASAAPASAAPAVPTADPLDAEKKRLEIKKLQQETDSLSGLRSLGPLLSVIVAAAVGLFASIRYFDERRRERRIRIEENIDRSLERLLEFPVEGKGFNVRTINTLQSLERWISLSTNPTYFRDRVIDAIVEAVMHDLDWSNRRHAGFDRLCLEHWPGYRERLQANPQDHLFLLQHYESALKFLCDRDPQTFSTIALVGGNFQSNRGAQRDDFLLFERLASGYQYHFSLIGNPEMREAMVDRFNAACRNPDLARQLLVDDRGPARAALPVPSS
ncbi:hypothetical protein [Micromonospora aurantiaca (nom. illeg.)]|uniref:hypothetical protein n=1 Tax=Micromonospora aurantiaca (nom. illeg.) TaxID=47850 RepID=UPI003F49D8BD